jgi:hypothetical protein
LVLAVVSFQVAFHAPPLHDEVPVKSALGMGSAALAGARKANAPVKPMRAPVMTAMARRNGILRFTPTPVRAIKVRSEKQQTVPGVTRTSA